MAGLSDDQLLQDYRPLKGAVISFDLKMELMDIYFEGGSAARSKAYNKIRRFLTEYDYEALGDSDYKNDYDSVNGALDKMTYFAKQNKWFPLCIGKLIVTPNSEQCDFTDPIKNEVDEKYKKKMEVKHLVSELEEIKEKADKKGWISNKEMKKKMGIE